VLYNQQPNFVCAFDPPLDFHFIDRFLEIKLDQWLLVMATQLTGFSIGGVCKRFLVSPPSMIWPANLVTSALFNTLHSRETSGARARGGISRERFFVYVFFGYILYSQPFSPGIWLLCLLLTYFFID